MTEVFRDLASWRDLRRSRLAGKTTGFVPTMGALHPGHVSLFERSVRENDVTIASIFVNPTQFNDPKDFEKYPITFEADLAKCRNAGVNYLLAPSKQDLYPDEYRYQISETELSRALCGAHRPGHFTGVLTIVLKLLQLADADRAYFGEKDYQQLLLIDGMTKAFFLRTAIVPCPTVREPDGLAMSSRNALLTPEHRELAPAFARALASAGSIAQIRAELERLGFEVDYIEERLGRRFGAVKLGSVRLIDNIPLGGSS